MEIAKVLLKLRKIGLTQVVGNLSLLADHSKMLRYSLACPIDDGNSHKSTVNEGGLQYWHEICTICMVSICKVLFVSFWAS
jgi:hypothetical protein